MPKEIKSYEDRLEEKIKRKIKLFNQSLPQDKQCKGYNQMAARMIINSEEYLFPLNKFQLREYKHLSKMLKEYINLLDESIWESKNI